MQALVRIAVAPLAVSLLLLSGGCAHDPSAQKVRATQAVREAQTDPPPMVKYYVTGSRIPQRINPCEALGSTVQHVRVHCVAPVNRTGHVNQLGGALRVLDPSVSVK
jgi:hypothetical protein